MDVYSTKSGLLSTRDTFSAHDLAQASGYTGILFGRGQQIQLTEDRENGYLGAVVPYSGVLEAAVIWYKKFHFI